MTRDELIESYLPKEPAPCPFCLRDKILKPVGDSGVYHICQYCHSRSMTWNSYLKHDVAFLLGILEEEGYRFELHINPYLFEKRYCVDIRTETERYFSVSDSFLNSTLLALDEVAKRKGG